jgi:hypothetical protein
MGNCIEKHYLLLRFICYAIMNDGNLCRCKGFHTWILKKSWNFYVQFEVDVYNIFQTSSNILRIVFTLVIIYCRYKSCSSTVKYIYHIHHILKRRRPLISVLYRTSILGKLQFSTLTVLLMFRLLYSSTIVINTTKYLNIYDGYAIMFVFNYINCYIFNETFLNFQQITL